MNSFGPDLRCSCELSYGMMRGSNPILDECKEEIVPMCNDASTLRIN
jgi:hypothetical protein